MLIARSVFERNRRRSFRSWLVALVVLAASLTIGIAVALAAVPLTYLNGLAVYNSYYATGGSAYRNYNDGCINDGNGTVTVNYQQTGATMSAFTACFAPKAHLGPSGTTFVTARCKQTAHSPSILTWCQTTRP